MDDRRNNRRTRVNKLCNTLIFMLGVILGTVFIDDHSIFHTIIAIAVSTLAFYLVQTRSIRFLYRKIK